jgi:nucleoside-diphosphate-sugar epimerase
VILLTGSSGFLGQVILDQTPGGHIKTLNRRKADYQFHLNEDVPIFNEPFEIVIHSAGKAHSVPKTEIQRQEFFNVNVIGTSNLLKGLEESGVPKAFVFISSVAVYGRETGNQIKEDTPLLALDAYGKSKIDAERMIQKWCLQNNVICTILRLPLIAGPNPPGNLGAMIKGIKKGYYFNIAAGKAKKSIVLAADVAKIIPVAAKIGGTYNLTDGYHPSFSELSGVIAKQLGKNKPSNIPMWAATIMAKAGDLLGSKSPINSEKLNKITSDLTFNDIKAQKILGWKPTPVLNGFKIK